jgi:hypothetical protein
MTGLVVARDLSPIGDIRLLPENEAQVRPLTPVEGDGTQRTGVGDAPTENGYSRASAAAAKPNCSGLEVLSKEDTIACMKFANPGILISASLASSLLFSGRAFADLKPFPLTAGQSGTVACLENPAISYTVYLPPAYSTNGTPLPILYTLNPSGGGLVSTFQTVCASLNMIVIGIRNSKDGATLNLVLRDFYAVPRDVRQRVLFDPSAEFVAGFSGGGENAYIFSRFWAQHVAGMFAMSGWMGCTYGPQGTIVYYTTSQVQTNLLVARTTGTSDNYTQMNWLAPDGSFLVSCGAQVKDWTFSGGHSIPPDSLKTTCLTWLLTNRIPAGETDETNSFAQADNWRSRAAAGQTEAVLRECVSTLMNQPRTWFALEAQLVMDDLMTNFNSVRSLNVTNLAQGDFASDLFFYSALGAATNRDWQRYDCDLKALTGITGTSGDRAGDICYVLNTFGYPAPWLQISVGNISSQANVWLREDVPGLDYSLQSRTDLVNDVWQDMAPSTLDTNAIWSATFGFDPGSASGFYRVGTIPTVGISPPWPNGFNGP